MLTCAPSRWRRARGTCCKWAELTLDRLVRVGSRAGDEVLARDSAHRRLLDDLGRGRVGAIRRLRIYGETDRARGARGAHVKLNHLRFRTPLVLQGTRRTARARSQRHRQFATLRLVILKVEITGYISLSKSMSLRDELVENERAASDTTGILEITRRLRNHMSSSTPQCDMRHVAILIP